MNSRQFLSKLRASSFQMFTPPPRSRDPLSSFVENTWQHCFSICEGALTQWPHSFSFLLQFECLNFAPKTKEHRSSTWYKSCVYHSIKALVCQWVCLFVCLFPNSSETTKPDELKFSIILILLYYKIKWRMYNFLTWIHDT